MPYHVCYIKRIQQLAFLHAQPHNPSVPVTAESCPIWLMIDEGWPFWDFQSSRKKVSKFHILLKNWHPLLSEGEGFSLKLGCKKTGSGLSG
jgi:hypothetical protein